MTAIRTAVLLLVVGARLAHAQSEADDLLREGLALAKAQRWTEAGAVLHDGQRRFPRDSRFPIELAGLAYRQKDERTAKRELQRGLALAPHDEYANDFLGTLFLADGNLAAALVPWNRIGKPVLGNVLSSPALPLKPLLAERTVPVSAGQVLTQERLLEIDANLRRLNFLADYNLELVPAPAQNDRYDLLLRPTSSNGIFEGWAGHLLPLARELPYQAVAADAVNLRREAINLRSLWRWDPVKRRIAVGLEAPWNGNLRIEQRYGLDVRDETWSVPGLRQPFLLRTGTLAGGFSVAFGPQLQWYAGARIEERTYARAPAQAAFRNGISAALDNRVTSDWLLAKMRLSGSETASLSAGRFAGSRLVETRAKAALKWLPGARQHTYEVSGQVQAGEVFGRAPLDQQYALAMERDTEDDLWLRGIVGTIDGRKGNGPIGRSFAIGQVDLQRRLFAVPFLRVSAGPFFDAGEVGHPLENSKFRGLQCDTGIEGKVRTAGAVEVLLICGRDLSKGGNAFYTAVRRSFK